MRPSPEPRPRAEPERKPAAKPPPPKAKSPSPVPPPPAELGHAESSGTFWNPSTVHANNDQYAVIDPEDTSHKAREAFPPLGGQAPSALATTLADKVSSIKKQMGYSASLAAADALAKAEVDLGVYGSGGMMPRADVCLKAIRGRVGGGYSPITDALSPPPRAHAAAPARRPAEGNSADPGAGDAPAAAPASARPLNKWRAVTKSQSCGGGHSGRGARRGVLTTAGTFRQVPRAHEAGDPQVGGG